MDFDIRRLANDCVILLEDDLSKFKVNIDYITNIEINRDTNNTLIPPVDDGFKNIDITCDLGSHEKNLDYQSFIEQVIKPMTSALANKIASVRNSVSFVPIRPYGENILQCSISGDAAILLYKTYDVKTARDTLVMETAFFETGKESGYRVFLGGICNDSKWREALIKELEINYFNPVVEEWTEECMEEEIRQREECDFCLYTITPRMTGVYSIAEVVDDSNKRPEKTIFCVVQYDQSFDDPEVNTITYDKHCKKSLQQVMKMVKENGGIVADNLKDIALYLNSYAPK